MSELPLCYECALDEGLFKERGRPGRLCGYCWKWGTEERAWKNGLPILVGILKKETRKLT